MIKPIVKDVLFLGRKSAPAGKEDIQTGIDLADTLEFHREECVGMAANMIGVSKNIIIVNTGMKDLVMFNPVILKKEEPYEAEEGCLSLTGVRKTTRYEKIVMEYYDFQWKKHRETFTGFTAEICQHEMDHLEGIII